MPNSFTKNLQRGFGLSIAILIASSIASYICIHTLTDRAEWVAHTNLVLQQSEKVGSLLKDAETGQRGYMLTGIDSFLMPYSNATQNIFSAVEKLTSLTSDNATQQINCARLSTLISKRMARLSELIRIQRTGKSIDSAALIEGQTLMALSRDLIGTIQHEENRLLKERTQSFDFLAWLTPLILLFTSIASIIITVFFYQKVKTDYDKRVELQQSLERNENETSKRIKIIEEIATQVSAGNYKVRVKESEEDNLGRLSGALNKMAVDLDVSFEDFTKREWMKNGMALLNEKMIGEKDVKKLAKIVIDNIVSYSGSTAAALYLCENNVLKIAASVGLDNNTRKSFLMGEGLIGRCAEEEKMIVQNSMAQEDIAISYAAGEVKPSNLAVFPVKWENDMEAVIETVSFTPYSQAVTDFFESISSNIGLSLESAKQNMRLQQLLSETQAQAEELQMQQHELEHLNSDLEAQAQKLQVSEEELKVQQEELLQANQELEERSSMLEEKNQMIIERNLEIQKKADELETTTKYKSEFMANMSHELRTPLNSILLLSRLMGENGEQNLTSEQVEFANVIQSSGNGLLTLIDEILDLSKIEAGKMKVEFREVNITETKNNLTALFAPMAAEKKLTFSIIIDKATPENFVTDPMRLEQILKNLLSNAIKFTSNGSVTMHINKADENAVRFDVTDTGIGIAEDKQNLVFEAFQQADGSTRRKYGGTGLGLSISRELAKLLGGEVKLQSVPDEGSTFSLVIPADAETATAVAIQPISATASVAEITFKPISNNIAPPAASPVFDDRDNIQEGDKIVLIIEDDITFAQTLLSFTHKNSYKGLVALRGDHGIELANRFLPTAILLDIKLPVKDGWQVMDELKANLSTRSIPVHMMSSMLAKEESLSRGAIDFIDKAVSLDKLPDVFKKIEEALQKGPKKILIVEENEKHAQALCYFLESYNINVKSTQEVGDAIKIFQDGSTDCVVLEMKVFTNNAYEALEEVKTTSGLEQLPIIIFTGKSLSKTEEQRLRQVADSIVVKTANSYKRILNEIDVFLQIVEENDSSKQKKSTRRLSGLEQVLENKTVLIADDDVRNIYSLTKALEAHKMTVITATDGKDALEQLKKNPKVNIILMDMMMPEMDGYDATREIRKMPQYRNLPVLAITAKAMYADREKCIQAGASDYISKPVDIDQLTSLLRVWLYA